MVRNEEGGVHTKKVIPILTVMSLLAVIVFAVPMISDSSEGFQFGVQGNKTIFAPGESLSSSDDDAISLVTDGTIYGASMKVVDLDGNSQSGAVSPTTTTFSSSNPTRTLTITAPTQPGEYRLVVEFELTNGGDKVTRTYPIKVVEPIVLSVTLKNNSSVSITDLDIRFVINGTVMELTSENTGISIGANSTKTVTYDWVTDSAPGGRNTYSLQVDSERGIPDLEGLNQEFTFYVGQNDYGTLTIIMVVILIILLLVLLWIIRKPVKNFGKPKGRR